jgi:hypothetical protein
MKIFYLERDFYSNPQVIIVIAKNRQEAETLLSAQLAKENNHRSSLGKLTELDLFHPELLILEPLGDRHLVR